MMIDLGPKGGSFGETRNTPLTCVCAPRPRE